MKKQRAPEVQDRELSDGRLFEVGLERMRADPLVGFHFSSHAQRRLAEMCGQAEVLWRAGNSSGKTWGCAAIAVALARGVHTLDGVKLPRLDLPNTGWVLSMSYKQQVDAVQAAYRYWIGDWPHKIGWVAGPTRGYIDSIHIATRLCHHGQDEMCATCSKIVFHCEESHSSVGGRIDWAHGDEPPDELIWREIRARKIAGRPFLRFISMTPLARERWEWIREEFQDCDREIKAGKFEIRSTLYDNTSLTEADIVHFENSFSTDPLKEARLKGDYVDTHGSCPFDYEILQEWLGRTEEGKFQKVEVKAERHSAVGTVLEPIEVEVERWEPPEPDERYFVICDPSLGINARNYDPSGLHVYARRRPRLVLRYNGYLGAYGLGSLAALEAQRYNKAMVDVDTGGGYGENVLRSLSEHRYGRIAQDMDPDRPGIFSPRLGFRLTRGGRNEMVGLIQQALLERSVRIWSAEVLQCLMGIRMESAPQGGVKYVTARGRHDEDLVLLGRFLALSSMPGYALARAGREESGRFAWQRALDSVIGRLPKKSTGRPAPRWR